MKDKSLSSTSTQGGIATSVQDAGLQRVIDLVVARLDPKRIILFGSRARRDCRPDSDIDLLIIEENARLHRRDRLAQVYVDLAFVDRPPTDLLLYSEDEFNRWRDNRNHVIGRASREGKLVYQRS